MKTVIDENSKYKTGLRRFGAAIIDTLVFIPLAFGDKYVRANVDNKMGLIFWLTCITAFTIFYSVFMHFKYGQTLGKMVAKVKVLTIDETSYLTITQALLRDSVYIIFQMAALLYFSIGLIKASQPTAELLNNYDDFGGLAALIWVCLELLSMLTNRKRRAIHDFIANSVVIKVDDSNQ